MVLGSGIRDPGSGKNLFRIPDSGVKKAPDPGSGFPVVPAFPVVPDVPVVPAWSVWRSYRSGFTDVPAFQSFQLSFLRAEGLFCSLDVLY